MANAIATAFVEVVPDTRLFASALQVQVNRAVRSITSTPVKVPVVAVAPASSLGAAVGESEALTAAQLGVAESAGVATAAERAYAAAIQAGGIDLAGFAAANEAAAIAEAEVGAAAVASGAAVKKSGAANASKGFLQLGSSANVAQGALIGLSRITPVAVFGLGLAGTAAIGAGLAIKGAITSAADFEKQLNILQATSGATAQQIDEISRLAKQLGADVRLPATSAADAAVALTELAKAGLSIDDSMAAARGVLQLAAAAGLDVGTAAKFAATELNAFGLAGDQATHVADLLAGASIAAQGEITDTAIALEQSAAAAHEVGLSLEQTTGLLTELAKAGLTGSDAGTSLRVTLLRLVPTTKQAAEFQAALGIRLDKTKSIGQQLNNVIEQYRKQLDLLAPTQRQAVLQQIFGQDAFRAGSIIFSQGAQGLIETTAAIDKQGTAAKLAGARSEGLSGAFQGLKSNAETLGITLGEFAQGPLTSVTTGLSNVVSGANKAAQALVDFQSKVSGLNIPGTGTSVGDVFSVLGQEVILHSASLKKIIQFVSDADSDFEKKIKEVQQSREGIANAVSKNLFGVDILDQVKPVASRNFGIGGLDLTAEQKRVRARIAALDSSNKAKKILLDKTAPTNLLNAQLKAQLEGSLQAELAADRVIEAFFEARLKTTKEGTKRFNTVLASLVAAHNATQSVQAQIASEARQTAADAAKAASDAAQAITDAFQLSRDTAQLAIERAQATPGSADDVSAIDVLIAIIQRQIASGKLKAAEIVQLQRDLVQLRANEKTLVDEQVQQDRDFQRSLLDLALHRAEVLTPNDKTDDAAIIQKLINRDVKLIALYKKEGKSKRDLIVTIENELIDLRAKLLGLKSTAGSFSLNDLFQEAANQFNTFGSNVSVAPITPGGARQAVAGGILAQRPQDRTDAFGRAIANKADQQIAEQAKGNSLLQGILDAVSEPAPAGNRFDQAVAGTPGFATSVHQRRLVGLS